MGSRSMRACLGRRPKPGHSEVVPGGAARGGLGPAVANTDSADTPSRVEGGATGSRGRKRRLPHQGHSPNTAVSALMATSTVSKVTSALATRHRSGTV
ncbi:hypothetical protein SAMN04489726_7511 [Allokutzneria albata]|uniref:Uncharacterized protein n=1 Tax=Allokutzneria albata TaxID=211114 RepID=A0A1H0CZU6_ALLAB|nr:hypothetical protein SAMN04489726_7511 [Allokutzneria albata]